MTHCFRDCVLLLLPKKNKDVTCNSSCHPIALASSLSKTQVVVLLHWLLYSLSKTPHRHQVFYLLTSPLQYGFNPDSLTTLCTGVVKNIISRYIHCGSLVHGCFLDASKHFILLITVFCLKNLLIVVYLYLFFASCHHGTALKR